MSAVVNDPNLLSPPFADPGQTDVQTVAVLGLGYVGLPTTLALRDAGFPVIGVDSSERRLEAIRAGDVDLLDRDRPRLTAALASGLLALTDAPEALQAADAVIIAVPTPIDERRTPDL